MLRLIRQGPTRDPGLGTYLVDAQALLPTALEGALAEQQQLASAGRKVRLGELLTERGLAGRADVDRALERQRRAREAAPAVGAELPRRVRTVIADDHAAVREGLRGLLTNEKDFDLVGVAADGAEALRLIRERRPDLVILDNNMPGANGLEVLRAVRADLPQTAVVIFSADTSIDAEALAAGAAAVINKDLMLGRLLDELRRIMWAKADLSAAATPTSETTLPPASPAPQRERALSRPTWAGGVRAGAEVLGIVFGFVGLFVISEPVLGAGAAAFSVIPPAIAGALIGPEAGAVTALLTAIASGILWQLTGHPVGETVVGVGTNGLGILTLFAVGVSFGAMRVGRGRLRARERRLDALVEAARVLTRHADRGTLTLVLEAAVRLVAARRALLFAPAADDPAALEIVAVTSDNEGLISRRQSSDVGPVGRAYQKGELLVVPELSANASTDVRAADAGSGLFQPIAGPGGRPIAVLALYDERGDRFSQVDAAALRAVAGYLAVLIGTQPAVLRADLVAPGRSEQEAVR